MPQQKNNSAGDTDNRKTDSYQTERDWHQERWEKQSANDSGPFGMREFFGKKRAAEEFMLNEADRDDADFERRQHEEFERWQQNLKVVIDNMRERATNPESEKRVLVVMMGGGMKIGYTAGQMVALNELGFTADKVDIVVGASSGSAAATAYVGGPEQTLRGTALTTGPLSSSEFISFRPDRIGQGNMINLQVVKENLDDKEGPFYLDQTAVRESPAELWFAFTDADGSVVYKDAKGLESISDGIVSSMSLPFMTGPVPEIDGTTYWDGAFNPLPIQEMITNFKPTDILILPQNPFQIMEDLKLSRLKTAIADYKPISRIGKKFALLEKGLVAQQALREALEHIQEIKGVNIGVLWPPEGGLSMTNIDSGQVTAAVLASARDTYKQFGAEQPDSIQIEPNTIR